MFRKFSSIYESLVATFWKKTTPNCMYPENFTARHSGLMAYVMLGVHSEFN